jgi:Zn finger protein HypA/HybF involved in hydrogenase expression
MEKWKMNALAVAETIRSGAQVEYSAMALSGDLCARCGDPMIWLHSSHQCPECGYKPGCCSGE